MVLKTVDVSYGGENGFNQAIELAAETLGSVKLIQEKRLLQKYFDEISQVGDIGILLRWSAWFACVSGANGGRGVPCGLRLTCL